MKIKFKNSIYDLVELQLDLYEKSPNFRKIVTKLIILPPIVITLCFLWIIWPHISIRYMWLAFFIILCFIILCKLFSAKIAKFQLKRLLIKRLKNDIKEDIEIILSVDENGINEEVKNGFTKFSWDVIEEVKDTDIYIYIYINKLASIIIPNNAFKDNEEKKEFLKIINENIKK